MDPFVDMCNGRSVIITHILLWYFRQATNVEIIAAIFNEYKSHHFVVAYFLMIYKERNSIR